MKKNQPSTIGEERASLLPGADEGSKELAAGRWVVLLICVGLVLLTLAVFAQTSRFEFCNFDDNVYVSDNTNVVHGFTVQGLVAAFSYKGSDNWVPLTTLSHMLDCQLYGLRAGGHHLTNVLLHILSVVLLFLVLRDMTGALWRSAFVAAVFAVHPLHVESVAWVAERKDVLSGVFFMLTLGAYVHYVRRPGLLRYLIVAVLFACGVMSKPMLVTMPVILLLLDYWPLKRFSRPATIPAGTTPVGWLERLSVPRQLILEKIPLLALSLVSCVLTVLAQAGAVQSFENFSPAMRIGNALVSCVIYLCQMFYPVNLAVYYPYPVNGWPAGEVILSGLVFAGISAGVFVVRKKRPYLLGGWLWYLVMLVPVIGLVQVSEQTRADRYTYLPEIGLYLMVAWLLSELSAGWPYRRWVLTGLTVLAFGPLIFQARRQTSIWKNNESLWIHTLACTTNNFPAHYNLGTAYLNMGRLDEAIAQYRAVEVIKPRATAIHVNLGNALVQKGKVAEAIIEFQKAVLINPDDFNARLDAGAAMVQNKQYDAAIIEFKQALAIQADNIHVLNDLGNALLQKGQLDQAIVEYRKAQGIQPEDAYVLNNLGNALLQKKQYDEAIIVLQKAQKIQPDYAEGLNDLGDALLQKGRLDDALGYFRKSVAAGPDSVFAQNNLANALFQKGQMNEAVEHYQKALALKPDLLAAQNGLARVAWTMSTSSDSSVRNGAHAVELARQVDQLAGGIDPQMAATLAAAYAEAGEFPEAITNVQRAIRLAINQNNAVLLSRFFKELRTYRSGSPLRNTIVLQ